MHTPDLIQRIYFEKDNGNDLNYIKVFNDLRAHDFNFIMDFDFGNRKIYWTCFEAKKYDDIIKESDISLYFYLWDSSYEFEIVIPAACYHDEMNKPILERTAIFHSMWIIGNYFPGLEDVNQRPIRINAQYVKRMDLGPIGKLSVGFKKMLHQYASLKKPIFERVDYPKEGEKAWKKITDSKKKK